MRSSALEGVAGGLQPHSPGLELCLGRLAARELPGSKVHIHLYWTCVLPVSISFELNHMTRCLLAAFYPYE